MSTIKTVYISSRGTQETRTLHLTKNDSHNSLFKCLNNYLFNIYGLVYNLDINKDIFIIRYRDNEDDICEINSDDELEEALRLSIQQGQILTLFIHLQHELINCFDSSISSISICSDYTRDTIDDNSNNNESDANLIIQQNYNNKQDNINHGIYVMDTPHTSSNHEICSINSNIEAYVSVEESTKDDTNLNKSVKVAPIAVVSPVFSNNNKPQQLHTTDIDEVKSIQTNPVIASVHERLCKLSIQDTDTQEIVSGIILGYSNELITIHETILQLKASTIKDKAELQKQLDDTKVIIESEKRNSNQIKLQLQELQRKHNELKIREEHAKVKLIKVEQENKILQINLESEIKYSIELKQQKTDLQNKYNEALINLNNIQNQQEKMKNEINRLKNLICDEIVFLPPPNSPGSKNCNGYQTITNKIINKQENNKIKNCEKCNKQFNLFIRRHTCRIRNKVYCSNCIKLAPPKKLKVKTANGLLYAFNKSVPICIEEKLKGKVFSSFAYNIFSAYRKPTLSLLNDISNGIQIQLTE